MATPLLDHVVVLVPAATLSSPPSSLTSRFTLFPGGRHADGLTRNGLVAFADGVYVELIAFDPADPAEDADDFARRRRAHWWGRETERRVVDWAYTLAGPDDAEERFKEVQGRVSSSGGAAGAPSVEYADPVPGGRTRPDGAQLKWAVAFPRLSDTAPSSADGDGLPASVRGAAPFWCFDRTPRELRVPLEAEGGRFTVHPCGARGVVGVTVRVPPLGGGAAAGTVGFDELARVYQAVHGVAGEGEDDEPAASEGGVQEKERSLVWPLYVPSPDATLGAAAQGEVEDSDKGAAAPPRRVGSVRLVEDAGLLQTGERVRVAFSLAADGPAGKETIEWDFFG